MEIEYYKNDSNINVAITSKNLARQYEGLGLYEKAIGILQKVLVKKIR